MKCQHVLIVALVVCSSYARANCALPQTPGKIPDGATATLEEMIAGRSALAQYDADVKTFTTCIEDEVTDIADKLSPKGTAETAQRIAVMKASAAKAENIQIDKLQAFADRFNEQIRVFKSRPAKN